MSALAPCAPQPSGEMMDFILNRVDAIADRELKALVLKRLEEAGDRLLYYPAASKLHHAERGGLSATTPRRCCAPPAPSARSIPSSTPTFWLRA